MGRQDNLTLQELRTARRATGIGSADALLDLDALSCLQEQVWETATQQILSQILLRDPLGAGQVQPAPAFLQTHAWWQQKMNTQLASWAQLRHDNLLYAKQSYTAGIVCEYPETYIEPEPDLFEPDMVVADVHTQPTDEAGASVGHVLHVGTGPLNQAIVVADLPHRPQVAFIGPVISYYEHVALGFDRLTDEEWRTVHAQPPSSRPDFVNLYLANAEGAYPGQATVLATAVEETASPSDGVASAAGVTTSSHPNPFNGSTLIRFRLGAETPPGPATLTVHNSAGQVVREVLSRDLGPGSYSVRWDGRDATGGPVASGQYYYRLQVGPEQVSGKMSLVR